MRYVVAGECATVISGGNGNVHIFATNTRAPYNTTDRTWIRSCILHNDEFEKD